MKYARVSNIVKEMVSRTNGRLETDTFQGAPSPGLVANEKNWNQLLEAKNKLLTLN